MEQTKTLFWKKAETDKQLEQIQRLYFEAFPKEERKPFELIIEKQKEGITEILSLEDADGKFYGLAITILHKDIVLLDYFAVAGNRRGGGIGSAALRMMQERSRGKRFILEIENTNIQAENHEQRIRRKEFYLKNGMRCMEYLVELVGVEMEVLVYDSELTWAEYQDIYDTVYPDRKLVRKVG
ncbi:MAG: GNAT family N-acetyltransferase [Eubacteriales bacterium]|nr:GNAT family N-acetyltransferase [Eubacteriales bacterium]